MSQKTIHSLLKENFSAQGKEVWKKNAASEIDGKDPFQELKWSNADHIDFQAYYDKEDVVQLTYRNNYHLLPEKDSYNGNRGWFCMPLVTVRDVNKSNKIALEHLAQGADGIFFDVRSLVKGDISSILQRIEWKYCALSFYVKEIDSTLGVLKQKIDSGDGVPLSGAIFWDTLPNLVEVKYLLDKSPNIKALGFYIKSSTAVQEIADALSQAVSLMSKAEVHDVNNTFSSITFSISVSTDFFETIAKLKALRMLWYQIAQAYGVKDYVPGDLKIHVRSEAWIKDSFQPHGNMLKSTTATLAAIIGGCNSISIHAEQEDNTMMSRIARNVSNILREESHVDKVSDPLAGAYAIEGIVHEIAQKAWSLFQSKASA